MTGSQETYHNAMNQGHNAAWEQNWEEATGWYQQALAALPDDAMALTSLGLAYFEQRRFDEALRMYQRAANLYPNDPGPMDKMARIYEMQGRIPDAVQAWMTASNLHLNLRDADKAVTYLQEAIALQPENVNARSRLAMILDKLGRKNEAITEYISVASLLQNAGEKAKVNQILQYLYQSQPDNPELRHALSLIRSGQPLPRPAKTRRPGTGPIATEPVRFEKAKEPTQTPNPVDEARQAAMAELAAMLFSQAEESQAGQGSRRGISSLTRGTGALSLEEAEQTRILLHLGQAIDSQTQGQDKQAAEELERATDVGLRQPAAYFDLGLLTWKNNPQTSLRYLQESVKHPDYALASYLIMAQVQHENGELGEAVISALQALRLADAQTVRPEEADELRQLYEPVIEGQTQSTDVQVLGNIYDTVMEQVLRPNWRDYLRMARAQLPPQSEGTPPLPLAEMLLESRSSQVVEAQASIRRLAAQNKTRSAMEVAFNALEAAPTYLPLHVHMGELLIQEGRVQDAVEKFMLVATLYTLRGEADQAIRLLTRVTQMAPMDLSVRERLIELLTAQGKIDAALQQYIDLAYVYYRLAELDLARQTYMTALKLTQRSKNGRNWAAQILPKLADIDLQRLDMRSALRIYEQLRATIPEETEPRLLLINLHFRMGQDAAAMTELDAYLTMLENAGRREKAIQFIEAVAQENPDKLEVHKRAAGLLMHAGEIDRAIVEMDQIADSLLKEGNRVAAIAILEDILALNPANAEKYERLLKQARGD
jgi:tetratricopeptide (TPR) repeat protein